MALDFMDCLYIENILWKCMEHDCSAFNFNKISSFSNYDEAKGLKPTFDG